MGQKITPQMKKAFDHVKSFFPSLSIVVVNVYGQWNYTDTNFNSFNFSDVDIDVSILEEGANSIQDTPFVYQEFDPE